MVCENQDYFQIDMPKKESILKYNHGEKSMKVPFIIYADFESLLEKINTCHNNPMKSSTTKINKHTPSGYSLFKHCSFDVTKIIQILIKKFCNDLKEHAIRMINCEKKEMIPLANKKNKLYLNQKVCHIFKKEFGTDDKKVRDHCQFASKYRGAAHDVCNLNYKVLKEIPIVLHNGSIYDYHFIIKELAKKI